MELGINIKITGIRGATDLDCSIPESDQSRRVKLYIVPETVSPDGYYISITMPGGSEIIPPCRGKDTLLLVDYHLSETEETTVNYINEEIENA